MELKMNLFLYILFMAAKPYNQQPADEVEQIFNEISQGLKRPLDPYPADKEEVVYEPQPPCSHMFRVYNITGTDYEKNSCGVDPTAQGQRRRRMVGGIRGRKFEGRGQKNLQLTKPWTVALVASFSTTGTKNRDVRLTTTGIIIHRLYVLVPTYGLPRGIKRKYANAQYFQLKILMGLPVLRQGRLRLDSSQGLSFDNIVDGDITYFDSGEAFNRDEAHLQFALIRLRHIMPYGATMQPVCIPAMPVLEENLEDHYRQLCTGPRHNERAVATGFGHNEHYAGEALLNELPFVVEQRNEDTGALLLRCQLDDQQPCGAAESDHGGPVLIERCVDEHNQQPRQFATSMITYIHAPPYDPPNGDARVLPHVISVDLMTMAPYIAAVITKHTNTQQQQQQPPQPPQQPLQPPQLAEPFQAGEPQAGPSHARMPWEDDDDDDGPPGKKTKY